MPDGVGFSQEILSGACVDELFRLSALLHRQKSLPDNAGIETVRGLE